jgi:hypothetical protein
MSRKSSILATFMLLFGLAAAFSGRASAQDTITLTLNLATCDQPGTVNTIGIKDAFDETSLNCDSSSMSWAESPNFLLNGVPADGGDNLTTAIFSGLVPGESYTLEEHSGFAYFEGGFTFTAPDTDFTLWAVFFPFYTPEETPTAVPTEPPSDEESLDVSILPGTGSGRTTNTDSTTYLLLAFGAMAVTLLGGIAVKGRKNDSRI